MLQSACPYRISTAEATTCDRFRQAGLAYWHGPDADDLAILHLEEPLPAEGTSLPPGTFGGKATHPFKPFGLSGTQGLRGNAGLWPGDKATKAGLSVLQLTDATEVTVGFCGGPLLNSRTRRIVGMVTSLHRPDEHRRLTDKALVIPIETLRGITPLLRLSEFCPYRDLAAFTEVDVEFLFRR